MDELKQDESLAIAEQDADRRFEVRRTVQDKELFEMEYAEWMRDNVL